MVDGGMEAMYSVAFGVQEGKQKGELRIETWRWSWGQITAMFTAWRSAWIPKRALNGLSVSSLFLPQLLILPP